MNTIYKNFISPLVVILTITLVFSETYSVLGQDLTPPAPKEPSSDLSMPEPVVFQEIKGSASLPVELELGFALDVGGMIIPGNWEVEGKVISHDNRTITFLTEKNETAHLVYRLPKGFQIGLEKEDGLFIQRELRGFQTSMGYRIMLHGPDSIEVASGILQGESPHEVGITEGLVLFQEKASKEVMTESQYETTYWVPVFAVTEEGKIKLDLFEPIDLKIHGMMYRVMIRQSNMVEPTKGYDHVAKGAGYIMEYIVLSGSKL